LKCTNIEIIFGARKRAQSLWNVFSNYFFFESKQIFFSGDGLLKQPLLEKFTTTGRFEELSTYFFQSKSLILILICKFVKVLLFTCYRPNWQCPATEEETKNIEVGLSLSLTISFLSPFSGSLLFPFSSQKTWELEHTNKKET
jgi:hypothetical protein